MAEGAVIDVARERDQALNGIRVLAAEIRAHEQTMRRGIASRRRPATDRLYRPLRQVNGGSDDRGKGGMRGIWAGEAGSGRRDPGRER
jgi:hypothetical protein